jgi:hypothetical protein
VGVPMKKLTLSAVLSKIESRGTAVGGLRSLCEGMRLLLLQWLT